MRIWTGRKMCDDIQPVHFHWLLTVLLDCSRSKAQLIPEKAHCSMILFSKCCAKKSAEPISTLAGDLNGCQVQRIVFSFDCCGAGRNQWERTRQAWITKDKKRKWDGSHLLWMQRMLYDYKQHERNTHNYSLCVTLERERNGSCGGCRGKKCEKLVVLHSRHRKISSWNILLAGLASSVYDKAEN